jgi:hypothetical protein
MRTNNFLDSVEQSVDRGVFNASEYSIIVVRTNFYTLFNAHETNLAAGILLDDPPGTLPRSRDMESFSKMCTQFMRGAAMTCASRIGVAKEVIGLWAPVEAILFSTTTTGDTTPGKVVRLVISTMDKCCRIMDKVVMERRKAAAVTLLVNSR